MTIFIIIATYLVIGVLLAKVLGKLEIIRFDFEATIVALFWPLIMVIGTPIAAIWFITVLFRPIVSWILK